MSVQTPYNIGAEISVRSSLEPQSVAVANSGAAINGKAIDLQADGGIQAGSAKFNVRVGDGTNTPTGITVTQKIQHSADGSTNWTDFKPDGTNVAQSTTGATALNTDTNLSVNLRMAQRYVRQVVTPTFSGASATINVGGSAALGGFPNTPVTDLNA